MPSADVYNLDDYKNKRTSEDTWSWALWCKLRDQKPGPVTDKDMHRHAKEQARIETEKGGSTECD